MATIQLRTHIPGPRSQDLMKRRNAADVQGAYHATPVFVAKAEGVVVEDVDGNRLIDFAGGIGCLNTGHRALAVVVAMAATSKTHPYKAGFEPFPSEVYRIPYAYCFRCSYSLTYPSCEVHCARHIEDTFKRVVAAESVAAVIVEPILGEGGFVTPPAEFFPILSEICRKYGILLIADEVQTGFGRTGTLFACKRLGLEPDLICI